MAAGWRRPEMYLDPEVRASMSWFALADPATVKHGVSLLRNHINTGIWRAMYGALIGQESIDWGYRFIKAL